jgi:multidrug efflux pump subunit AcrB
MIKGVASKHQAVFVFAIMVVIMGWTSYSALPRESTPEIKRPIIFVTTVYSGVSAVDMETLVTKEIEDELEGLEGLEKVTSSTSHSMSQVTAEFNGDVEVETARRRVQERVDVAKPDLPEDAEEPSVRELNFSDQPVFIINISNPNGLEVLELPVDYLEDEIKAISGVLDVRVSGKLVRELEISLDPSRLKHYGFSIEDVQTAIRNENVTIPGGVLKNKVQQYSLSVSGEIKDPAQFGEIVVRKNGNAVKLKDLGTVAFRFSDPTSYNRMDGIPAVSLSVTKRSGKNLIEMIDNIKDFLDTNKSSLPHGTIVRFSLDESDNIRRMVRDLENNIASGLILVLIVTLFFLGPVNALFVSLGIPFSMLISFFVINALGYTLNMVVLFSLVLALGMLVDNGIVIVENIYRHRSLGLSRFDAAVVGTKEVAWPITTSTLTTILAFFPIVFMPDIMGEFMSYIPKTVIIVLTASLVVGLTITMVFCSRFLKISDAAQKAMNQGSTRFQNIQAKYQNSLVAVLDRPWRTLMICFAVVVAGIVLNGALGKESIFFPHLDPESASVSITTPSGTPLEKTDELVQAMEKTTRTVPNSLDTLQGTTGKDGGRGGGRNRSNKGSIRIGFKPYDEREVSAKETIDELKKALSAYTGVEARVSETKGGPPSGHDVSFVITGEDYTVMGAISEQIYAIVQKHQDILEDMDSDFEAVKPEIKIDIDREKAALYGLNTRLIASSIRTAINGSRVSKFRQGREEYDVIVKFQEASRNRLQALQELEVVKDGKRINLGSVASIQHQSTVDVIKRKNRHREVSVYADFKPGVQEKELIKQQIKDAVAELKLPTGYKVGSGEGQQIREEATQFLMQAFLIALLLIFIVMVMQFNSVTQPFIILISVFLSVGGVFWGLFIARMPFVIIMSGIGTISLAGVVVNNAIVLIDFINQLYAEGKSAKDAVIEGGMTRLRPVLLTAITTVIGLLPMALGISFDFHNFSISLSSESSDWWGHMAWAVIFGLSFATVLTLFVVPALTYIDLTKGQRWQAMRERFTSGRGPKKKAPNANEGKKEAPNFPGGPSIGDLT